jgi:hypothetical protein
MTSPSHVWAIPPEGEVIGAKSASTNQPETEDRMSNVCQESPVQNALDEYKRQADAGLKALGATIVDTLKDEYEGSDTEWDDVVDVINRAITGQNMWLTRSTHGQPAGLALFPLLEKPAKEKFVVNVSYEIEVEAWTAEEAEEIADEELGGTIWIGDNGVEAGSYCSMTVDGVSR